MTIITASINKPSAETKAGITLKRTPQGNLVVSKISNNSDFAQSDLRPGMKVLSINNQNVENMDPKTAIEIIKSAVGVVTVAADDTPESKAAKTAPSAHSPRFAPPPSVPDGGVWGKCRKKQNAFSEGLNWLWNSQHYYIDPVDGYYNVPGQTAYLYQRTLYDQTGRVIGNKKEYFFKAYGPTERNPTRCHE